MRRYPRRAESCCGVLGPCWVRRVCWGRKPDVGLENMKGVLRGKKTCGLSKGVSEVGAHKGDSLIRGEGVSAWGEHPQGRWLGVAYQILCVFVCLTWRINSHRMKRASTNPVCVCLMWRINSYRMKRASTNPVCVCLTWRINSHRMKRASTHASSSTWAVRAWVLWEGHLQQGEESVIRWEPKWGGHLPWRQPGLGGQLKWGDEDVHIGASPVQSRSLSRMRKA